MLRILFESLISLADLRMNAQKQTEGNSQSGEFQEANEVYFKLAA